jgi:DNA polymerase III subunit delta'
LAACGHCPSCVQVAAGSHPDMERVTKPEDKSFLPLELFIGDVEHRMRAGLCYNLALKPFYGQRKIAIVDDADYFNQEGANSLLKTLEEPPPGAVLILIGTSEQRQLPTIRSRCRIVRFSPLDDALVERILLEQELVMTPDEARRGALLGQGSVSEAVQWLEPTLAEFREQMLQKLSTAEFDQFETSALVQGLVDQGPKESQAKRQRLHRALDVAESFYRCMMRALAGQATAADPQLTTAVDAALPRWPRDADAAALCLERTLAAHGHVDMNAGPVNVIDAWLDDLGLAIREGTVAS